MLTAFKRHREWHLRRRPNDEPQLVAIGMLKALRNIAHQLLLAKQHNIVDRPKVVEAIGDMFMYVFSHYHVTHYQNFIVPGHDELSLEWSISNLTQQIASLIIGGNAYNVFRATTYICTCCCITPDEAIEAVLPKLETK